MAYFPKAVRISDDQIVILETGVLYTHELPMNAISVQQPGSHFVAATQNAAENLWRGLCEIADDWRGFSLPHPFFQREPE